MNITHDQSLIGYDSRELIKRGYGCMAIDVLRLEFLYTPDKAQKPEKMSPQQRNHIMKSVMDTIAAISTGNQITPSFSGAEKRRERTTPLVMDGITLTLLSRSISSIRQKCGRKSATRYSPCSTVSSLLSPICTSLFSTRPYWIIRKLPMMLPGLPRC